MWPNPQFPADLVTFTEKMLNGKLFFLCSVGILFTLSKSLKLIRFRKHCWLEKNSPKSFPLKISLVNVNKSEKTAVFITFTKEILKGKFHFLCGDTEQNMPIFYHEFHSFPFRMMDCFYLECGTSYYLYTPNQY